MSEDNEKYWQMNESSPLMDRLNEFAEIQNWKTKNAEGKPPISIDWVWTHIFENCNQGIDFYNFSLFLFYNSLLSDNKIIDELESLIAELESMDSHKLLTAFKFLKQEKIAVGFNSGSINLLEILEIINYSPNISQQHCFLYQQAYELEEILLVLAVILELYNTGNLNYPPSNLMDSKGNLKKGNAILYIVSRIDQTKFPELYGAVNSAYNIDLRNTIGHNKYKRYDDKITATNNSNVCISKDVFFHSLISFFKLKNSVLNVMQKERDTSKLLQMSNCGILNFGFYVLEGKPVLEIMQLWCFQEINNSQDWVKSIKIEIRNDSADISCGSYISRGIQINENFENWINSLNATENHCICLIYKTYPFYSQELDTIELNNKTFNISDITIKQIIQIVCNTA